MKVEISDTVAEKLLEVVDWEKEVPWETNWTEDSYVEHLIRTGHDRMVEIRKSED